MGMKSMALWKRYTDQVAEHTVVGDLRVARDVVSPQLNNQRDVFVWLPPSYAASERRYPVIYMHDGLNLFDRFTSYSGEWQVDETVTTLALADPRYEAIIVGLPNMKEKRGVEYSPYDYDLFGARLVGQGDFYMRFIIETIKPLIDHDFRTRPETAATGIAGSSMGGLISLYGFLRYPQVFGLCGAFSTAYWFGENALLRTAHERATGHGRVYLDVGTKEGETLLNWTQIPPEQTDAAYCDGVRVLRDALVAGGYTDGHNLMYVEEEGALHREAAWARRLPEALRFLLREIQLD